MQMIIPRVQHLLDVNVTMSADYCCPALYFGKTTSSFNDSPRSLRIFYGGSKEILTLGRPADLESSGPFVSNCSATLKHSVDSV